MPNAAEYRISESPPATNPDSFEARLRKIAQQLRQTIADLAPRETNFLYDLAREETRYPMPTVLKICGLSRRSRNPMAREAFAQLIRDYSVPLTADAGITAAFDLETPVPGRVDLLQRQFDRDRNPITYARVKGALEEQVAVSQLALESVKHWGRKNGLEPNAEPRTSR